MRFRTIVRRNKERGIAMLVAMLAIVLLAIIGLGFMYMADIENNVNTSYKQSEKSYFASRAGLENVRLLLVPPDPKTGLGGGALYNQAENLSMPTIGANTGVIYVENPKGAGDVIDPTTAAGGTVSQNPTVDDELCQEQFASMMLGAPPQGAPCEAVTTGLPSVSTYFQPITPATNPGLIVNTNSASALPFKWVRITNKQNYMPAINRSIDSSQPNGLQVCWDGSTQRVIPAGTTCDGTASLATQSMRPVWLLTSLAVTPSLGQNAGARRITQMEVANSPPLVPNAPIATQAPVKLQGSYVLNSYDNCTCTCSTSNSNGSGSTTTCGGTGCYKGAYAVETAGDVTVAGNTQPISGQSSPYQTGVNPWPFDINQLINQYKSGAQIPSWSSGCTGTVNFNSIPPQYANCGTQTNQNFGSYPSSSLPAEPAPGSYTSVTEYIPGSVKLTSAATGSGILIVDGDLEINGGLNWYGLVLVRGKVSFTGGAGQNVNLYGSILAGEDVLAVNNIDGDVFGGSINFQYDVCALKRSAQQVPPRILATHEITF
ncbi:MAG TPA: hypothetical protein VFY05_08270 [Candidatus Angelobacter sp.]|nr:hypothetical protein [Candidatus Angelobacter sp.]